MDSSITTGPVVIVPLAIVFHIAGVGLLQARLLMAVVAAGGLLVYGVLARRLVGAGAALVALVILLAGTPVPYTSYVMLGRQALGEVPAFALCLYGIWLWLRAFDNGPPAWWRLAIAGLAFGLSILTKTQMVIGIAPMLVVVCLADRLYYRQASWRAFLIPAAVAAGCQLAWMAFQMAYVGYDATLGGSKALGAGVRSVILGLEPVHIRHAIAMLWSSGFWVWGFPGLLYGCWLARTRDARGLAHLFPASLALLWLLWYSVFSVGWPRYGFVPLALVPIWSARLVLDALRTTGSVQRILAAIAIAALLGIQVRPTLEGVFGPQDQSAALFSAYLAEHVPTDAVVASWEWNLDTTAPQRFAHPSPLIMYNTIDLIQRDIAPPEDQYDPAIAHPQYLVDGPFSSWTGIYRRFIASSCRPITTIGPYTLYQVMP
jgi:4-amino-4-deoxy-L-arabinose transferase-like glycosyltransferase